MKGGRPLRFLALTLGGWMAIRIALLLPDAARSPRLSIPDLIPDLISVLVSEAAAMVFRGARGPPLQATQPRARPPPPTSHDLPWSISDRHHTEPSPALAYSHAIAKEDDRRPVSVLVPRPQAPPVIHGTNRLAGTAWLLVRGGAGGTLSGGQLGASQGGVRVTYALGNARRFALAARIAVPMEGPGREAALGVEWQPTSLPIRLIAEQRFVLDGGRGGSTVGVIAGYGPADVAHGLRIEAYGQAGAIARDGIEGFIDASARATHRLGTLVGVPIETGIGVWASAQRGAHRVDVGPSLTAAVPVSGKTLRVMVDWRERIAGTARPGSGPALSVGSDF